MNEKVWHAKWNTKRTKEGKKREAKATINQITFWAQLATYRIIIRYLIIVTLPFYQTLFQCYDSWLMTSVWGKRVYPWAVDFIFTILFKIIQFIQKKLLWFTLKNDEVYFIDLCIYTISLKENVFQTSLQKHFQIITIER